jgi:hypothetical protein
MLAWLGAVCDTAEIASSKSTPSAAHLSKKGVVGRK